MLSNISSNVITGSVEVKQIYFDFVFALISADFVLLYSPTLCYYYVLVVFDQLDSAFSNVCIPIGRYTVAKKCEFNVAWK